MSKFGIMTVATVAVSIIAASMPVFATPAAADSWNGRHRNNGYARSYQTPHGYNQGRHSDRTHDRTGERIAKSVIIGVGAAIIGAILSDAARAERRRGYRDYDNDE